MADLRVNLSALHELDGNLAGIAAEFRDANVHSDAIAAATGHVGLEEAVRDFAHGWDDKREDLAGDVEVLAQAAGAMADAFTQMDAELAAVAEGAQ